MISHRKTAIIVGVFFLIGMVALFLGDAAIAPILNDPDYLTSGVENNTPAILGTLIAFLMVSTIVGIAVLMFPLLKKHNEPMALGYVGFRITELAIITVYLFSPLLLITLGQEYVSAGGTDASSLQAFTALFEAGRYWGLRMIWIFNGLAGLMFAYLLYKSKLVPRFFPVLGLIGYALLLPGAALDVLGHVDMLNDTVGIIAFLPGGLFEIGLPIWLLVKGFNSSAIDSASDKTETEAR